MAQIITLNSSDMSVIFPCFFYVGYVYLLLLYFKNSRRAIKQTVNDESQKLPTSLQNEISANSSNKTQTQNVKSTDETEESQKKHSDMNAMNGVGSVLQLHAASHFEWEIKNFSNACSEVGEFFLSPIFTITCLNNCVGWRLRLYPRGEDNATKEYLSLYIECQATGKVTGDVIFSLLNDQNCKKWGWRMNEKVFDNRKYLSWGNNKFVQRHLVVDQNNRVLLNDTLKISCEIILNPKNNRINDKLADGNSFDYRLEHLNDFEKLLETGNGSDVTFRVDGIEIKAHKAFILSCSPVFQAMFEHEMREKEKNVVEVLDIKYHIMKELLRFMYAGKVNNIESHARELLAAAEKYSVKGLKVLCERELSRKIKFKNVFELLELATMYNASFLKSQTIVFIVTNRRSIVDRPDFKKFANLHADTICEIFRAVVRSTC